MGPRGHPVLRDKQCKPRGGSEGGNAARRGPRAGSSESLGPGAAGAGHRPAQRRAGAGEKPRRRASQLPRETAGAGRGAHARSPPPGGSEARPARAPSVGRRREPVSARRGVGAAGAPGAGRPGPEAASPSPAVGPCSPRAERVWGRGWGSSSRPPGLGVLGWTAAPGSWFLQAFCSHPVRPL